MALVANPASVDVEGHVVATSYLHGDHVYTSRAALCTLKDTSELLEVDIGDVTSCECCAVRLAEAQETDGRFRYHPPAPPAEEPTADARSAASDLADALIASGVDIAALLTALKKGA